MQQTNGTYQIDLFSNTQPLATNSKSVKKKVFSSKLKTTPNSVSLNNGKSSVSLASDGITVRHHNASENLPNNILMFNDEYDASADDLVINWTDENVLDLWDGMLNEHLKMLRQTKPGTNTRLEILEWQESESFKELCAAIAYRPDDIRDGVLAALNNYDFVSQTRDVITLLTKLDESVIALVADAKLTRRECNSRLFKDHLADWFLSSFRKASTSKAKWDKTFDLLHSEKLDNLASEIGLDMSGVINRIKPKLYFIQNPSESEFDI